MFPRFFNSENAYLVLSFHSYDIKEKIARVTLLDIKFFDEEMIDRAFDRYAWMQERFIAQVHLFNFSMDKAESCNVFPFKVWPIIENKNLFPERNIEKCSFS